MSTSLSLNSILNVAISVSPSPAPGPSFNQALIAGSSTVIPSATRTRLYQSLAAMTSDSWLPTAPEYLAAELYFSQTPQPTYLWIGRQDLTAIATVAIGASAGSNYVVGDVITVVQSGASGGQLSVTTISSGGVVTGVSIIVGSQGTGYSAASNLATTGGSGTGLEINILTIGETPLQAITACRLQNPQWYCCQFVGTAADADHLAIAAYIQGASPNSLYFLTSGDAAILANSANNLFAQLQAAKYSRTFPVYSTTQGGLFPNNAYASAGPMGLAMGLNTGAPGSYFDLMFKTIAGVAYEPLTQTQVNSICGTVSRSSNGLNGNVVVQYANGAYQWIQNATMASGDFFDEIMNLDMLSSDMQTSGVNLLVSVPALPITDGGVSQMANVISGACDRAQSRGFIAPSGVWKGVTIGTGNAALADGDALPKGYYVYAPPVSSMSAAQRAARIMPSMTVALVEAQSGHSLQITVEVQS